MAHTEAFSFASSSALELPVSLRVNYLDGFQHPIPASILLKNPQLRQVGSNQSATSELYVTVQLWADSKPLTLPVQTPYKQFKASRTWNEWITLPITYSSIPLSAQVAITIWDLSPGAGPQAVGHSVPFGGTTIPLFDKDGTLRKGRQRCHVHRNEVADGLSNTTTPFSLSSRPKSHSNGNANGSTETDEDMIELERLQELMKKHEMSEIDADYWLDPMVFNHLVEIEHLLSRKAARGPLHPVNENGSRAGEIDPGHFFLYIDFPRFDHPVVFTDYEYPAPPISTMVSQRNNAADIQLRPPPEVTLGPGINDADREAGRLIRIFDPEVGIKENPVENKHRRLVRNQRTGVLDRDLKPNAKIRDELSNIISYGPMQELKPEETDLVWKFRHHLTRNKRALTKFVKSVHWKDPGEARQASQLLPKWIEIDVDDALELLGPTFTNPAVRTYAVDRLRKADDDELLVYLLQLVQALKFEKSTSQDSTQDPTQSSSLAKFLVSRAIGNEHLGNFLHWYLMVECDDKSQGQTAEDRKLFARVEFDFMTALLELEDGASRRKVLLRQGELITVLSRISKDVRFSREDRIRKIDRLKRLLQDPDNELLSFQPALPLPLDPSVSIVGIYPEQSNVFKSSLFPLLITFKTATGDRYPLIFKTGDDLRQDQLVIQIIMLMDRLLRKENLDLKLSPYRILATSPTAGAVQFVPSMSLAAIVSKYKASASAPSILAYLRANNPDPSTALGVRQEAMDTYIKSCAGYCVHHLPARCR